MSIRGAHAGDEVVLECADCPFGGVATVKVRRCKLEVDFFFFHEGLEGNGGFVVDSLECGLQPTGGEQSVGLGGGRQQDGRPGFVSHGFHMNKVAIIIVYDEHVVISTG